MENESVEVDSTIQAIKEEYEKKLEEQKKAFEEDKAKALKEQDEKHIAQIRALMTGRQQPEEVKETAMTFEEELTANMRKIYKI